MALALGLAPGVRMGIHWVHQSCSTSCAGGWAAAAGAEAAVRA